MYKKSAFGITSILQVKGLDDDFTNRVTVEREGETQGKGDDQSSHQNQRIQSRIGIKDIGSLLNKSFDE